MTEREPWVKKEGGSFDITMGAYDRQKCVNLSPFTCYI